MRLPRFLTRPPGPLGPDALLLGFDLETTGKDPRTALPVSYAFVETVAYAAQAPPTFSEYALVNPSVPIPADTTAIHGITDEQIANALDLNTSVAAIGQILVNASQKGTPVVGMNVVYDLTIIDTLWRAQSGRGLREHGWRATPVIDILVIDRHLDRYRSGSRNLTELCRVYGVDRRSAHNATGDVLATLDIARKLLQNPFLKTLSPAKLTDLQKTWRSEWAAQYSQHRADQGKPPLHIDSADWPTRRYLAPGTEAPLFAHIPNPKKVRPAPPTFPSRFNDPNLTKEIVDQLRAEAKTTADPAHPLFGRQVHFTGTFSAPRASLQEQVLRVGGEVAGPLASTTAYLVVGFQDPKRLKAGATHSTRYLQAQELQGQGSQIQFIEEATLAALLSPILPPPLPVSLPAALDAPETAVLPRAARTL